MEDSPQQLGDFIDNVLAKTIPPRLTLLVGLIFYIMTKEILSVIFESQCAGHSVLATETDESVIPYTSCFLNGPGMVNTKLQDICPQDLTEHLLLAVDQNVFLWILNQLDPANAKPIKCLPAPSSLRQPNPNTQNLT